MALFNQSKLKAVNLIYASGAFSCLLISGISSLNSRNHKAKRNANAQKT